jgi:hypothetical protein
MPAVNPRTTPSAVIELPLLPWRPGQRCTHAGELRDDATKLLDVGDSRRVPIAFRWS